jgi:hypothetical protein
MTSISAIRSGGAAATMMTTTAISSDAGEQREAQTLFSAAPVPYRSTEGSHSAICG